MGTQGGGPGIPGPRRAVSRRRCSLLSLAGACALYCLCAAHAEADGLRFKVGGDITYDDNVNRGTKADRLNDGFATLNLSATLPLQLTPYTRLLVTGTVGGDKWNRYTGLDRAFAEFNGELQYRGSGQYTSPIYAIFARQSADWYDSNLRDGYRTSAGVSIRKPVTDRIFLFGAAAYNQRDGKSTVFDTREVAVRGNVDYALTQRQTVYLGLEYKDGDSVSTSRSWLALVDIAQAIVPDDVFANRFSYRFKARTGIVNLGYNLALGQRQALDLSYRGVYSRPKDQPPSNVTTDIIYYVDNQVMLSYLIRF
jgi:hypothetical protein